MLRRALPGSEQSVEVALLDGACCVGFWLALLSVGDTLATWGCWVWLSQALRDLPESSWLIVDAG